MTTYLLVVAIIWFVTMTIIGNGEILFAISRRERIEPRLWTFAIDILATAYIVWWLAK